MEPDMNNLQMDLQMLISFLSSEEQHSSNNTTDSLTNNLTSASEIKCRNDFDDNTESISCHNSVSEIDTEHTKTSRKMIVGKAKLRKIVKKLSTAPKPSDLNDDELSSILESVKCKVVNRTAGKTKLSREQCRFCKKVFINHFATKRSHAIAHLKTESNIKWLYKCLLCSKTTFNRRSTFFHIAKWHDVPTESLESGIHYAEQESLVEPEIVRIQRMAFPDTWVERKPSKPANNASETNRLTCQLCNESVSSIALDRHVLKHLSEEAGISWLFKCLLCNKFQTLHRSSVPKHMVHAHEHELKCPVQEGVHFVSQKSQFNNEIARVRLLAFPQTINSKSGPQQIPLDGQQSSLRLRKQRKLRQCQLCGKLVKTARHPNLHLPDMFDINWLFKCLLCDHFQTLHNKSMVTHVAFVHDMKSADVQSDIHYTNLTSKFANEIGQVRLLAFPPDSGI